MDIDIILLRFDAPIMSFGAPIVDELGKVQPYPAQSMMCGLLGNALGFHHSDVNKLQRLQERLNYAVRQDQSGERIQDFQTVDITPDYMQTGWTTRGVKEVHGGGKKEKLIRYRDYFADALYTVALTLAPPSEEPDMDQVEKAIKKPERPLFIGRKACLPSRPLFVQRYRAEGLKQALVTAPLPQNDRKGKEAVKCMAWWPSSPDTEETPSAEQRPVTDERDWTNQIHVGERWIAFGRIEINTQEVLNNGL